MLRDLLEELSQQNTIAAQSKALLSIIDHFKTHQVPQQQLVGCWEKIRIFTTGQLRPEAYDWIHTCLSHHYDSCDLLRLDFFRILDQNNEFIGPKLVLLKQLTKDGRDVRNFEHDVGPVVGRWILLEAGVKRVPEIRIDLIQFITNLVKFSFIYVDEESLVQMIQGIKQCFLTDTLRPASVGFLDAVGRYGYTPQNSIETVVELLCAGVNDKDCQDVAWPIFKNALVSHSAISTLQSLLSILYQSEKDLSTLLGALEILIRIYRDGLFPEHGASVVLKSLKSCCKTQDMDLARLVLECTVLCLSKSKDYLDYDIAVSIFKRTEWIWINNEGQHMHFWEITESLEELKSIWNYSTYLLSLLSRNFPGLSTKSKSFFLITLCQGASFQVLQIPDFVLRNWNSTYWSDQKEFYHDFRLMIKFLYIDLSIQSDIRIRALKIFFDVFLMDKLVEVNATEVEEILKLILDSIKTEKEEVLQELSKWILRVSNQLSDVIMNQIIDITIGGICNVLVVGGISLDDFWEHVSHNKRVKVVPSPLDTPDSFKHGQLEYAVRQYLLYFGFQLFEVLVDGQRPQMACLLFSWFARVSGWHTFVDHRLRLETLEFLQHFSCDPKSRITFLPFKSKERKSVYEIFTHNANMRSESEKHVLALDQLMFSLISIIKYDPNPLVLVKGIEAAQQSLQQQLFWIHNPISLKILADTITNAILKESACEQLQEIPSTFKKLDVYQVLYQLLLHLFTYKHSISKAQQDSFIPTLLFGVGRWPPIAKYCMQGLQLALYSLPHSITKYLPAILLKISQVTSSNLAIANLEFLASLASLTELHVNLTLEDYRRIFGIALTYLRQKGGQTPQILTLAYYVAQIWFLSIDLNERKNYIPMIIQFIVASAGNNQELVLDESIELVLDMMVQHSCIDCAPTVPDTEKKDYLVSKTWCIGNSLLSINTIDSRSYQVVIRRPAGVTIFETSLINQVGKMSLLEKKDAIADQLIKKDSRERLSRARSASTGSIILPQDNFDVKDPATGARPRSLSLSQTNSEIDAHPDPSFIETINPGFLFLQFQPYPLLQQSFQPALVPLDDQNKRALSILDRTPAIDLHKIGIVYVGPNQSTEVEILKNKSGSPFYTQFLRSIGTTFELSKTKVFTGGLDTSSDCLDGKFAICFIPDQRLSQVIFHTTTMMPTLPHDTQCIGKKRHIGNDFVTIVWNESGLIYHPETIPSQFNLVQIVIEPVSGHEYPNFCFRVHTIFHPSMNLQPFPTLVSGSALASCVRQTSIFCNMMAQVHVDGERISNSKERLRQIKRLRQRIETPVVDTPLDFTHLLK